MSNKTDLADSTNQPESRLLDKSISIFDTESTDSTSHFMSVWQKTQATQIIESSVWWIIAFALGYSATLARGCLVLNRDGLVDVASILYDDGVMRRTIAVTAVATHAFVMTEMQSNGMFYCISMVVSLLLRLAVGTCPIEYSRVFWLSAVVVPVWPVFPVCAVFVAFTTNRSNGSVIRMWFTSYCILAIMYAVVFGSAGVVSAVCDLLAGCVGYLIDHKIRKMASMHSGPPMRTVATDDSGLAMTMDHNDTDSNEMQTTADRYVVSQGPAYITADEENMIVSGGDLDNLDL